MLWVDYIILGIYIEAIALGSAHVLSRLRRQKEDIKGL